MSLIGAPTLLFWVLYVFYWERKALQLNNILYLYWVLVLTLLHAFSLAIPHAQNALPPQLYLLVSFKIQFKPYLLKEAFSSPPTTVWCFPSDIIPPPSLTLSIFCISVAVYPLPFSLECELLEGRDYAPSLYPSIQPNAE